MGKGPLFFLALCCVLQDSYIGSTQCLNHSVLSCGLPDSLQDRGKSEVILLDSLTS